MEKKKFFLILALAGALVIFLQQDSLQLINRHLNKSNALISDNWDSSANDTGHSHEYYNPLKSEAWMPYKYIHGLSRSKESKEKSKERLKSWLSGFNPLSRFPVYNGLNQTRILLVAYFRSGSSFVGDLMQQNWKSFYSFEPLHLMTRYTRIEDSNLTQALSLITSIYSCEFKPEYVKWIQQNQFLLKWNKFLWNVCRFRMASCFNAGYMSQACHRSKYNIAKVVRLPLRHLEILWRQLAPLNVKVVYLVRDPRGIYNSRKNMEWCNKEDICANMANICSDMRQDIADYDRLKRMMGDNLQLVRYEDISLDPLASSRQLFAKLKLDYSPSVSRFVKTHTKSRHPEASENPYSTYRANSSLVAFQWMNELNSSEILFAQENCKDILARFDYKFLNESVLV